jgi:hypothetical protein
MVGGNRRRKRRRKSSSSSMTLSLNFIIYDKKYFNK